VQKSAAILAGGRALRFGGRDKSALVVDGQTILDRQLAAINAVEGIDEVMLIGGRTVHAGVRAIDDVVPGSGPLGGIHTALTHATHGAVFVAACDMPYLSAALITRLFEPLPDADVVVARTNRGYHPLCAVYTRACLEPIARRLADRRLKVRELFEDVRTRVVTLVNADLHLVANVNTPEELAALQGHDQP
jgi:molybdenum cofactor guanylyltransferase